MKLKRDHFIAALAVGGLIALGVLGMIGEGNRISRGSMKAVVGVARSASERDHGISCSS
jgi:hypothetical protein